MCYQHKFRNYGTLGKYLTSAIGKSIREIASLQKHYGIGRWRKRKGFGFIKLPDGTICRAELHWYDVHGIGKKEFKIKQLINDL